MPLKAPRCADTDERAHQQAEIQRPRMEQQPFEDIVVTPQMDAPHAAGFEEMRKGALQPLASLTQQALASRAPNASAIAIHGAAGLGVLFQLRRPRSGSEM